MINAPPLLRHTESGIEVAVRLTPRSSKDAIEGVGQTADGGQHLKARVRALPEDGKANRALERLAAKWFGVAPRDVSVVAGATSRLKTLAVNGDAESLAARVKTASSA